MIMLEEWKEILDGLYEVSSIGRVRRLISWSDRNRKPKTGSFLKHDTSKNGQSLNIKHGGVFHELVESG